MNQPPSQGGFPPPGQFPPQPTQPQGGYAQQPAQPQGGFATPQGGYAQQPAPQPQFPPPSQGGGGGGPMGGVDVNAKKAEAAGFLKSLVDFSFENFVSPRVLKVMYGFWLFMLVPSVFGLFFSWYTALTYENYDYMTGQSSSDPQFGMFCASTTAYPIMVFMWVLMGRVLFERGILAFRQYELNKQILEELQKR
jgi:hypothetical protein